MYGVQPQCHVAVWNFPESTYKGTGDCARVIQDYCASKYKLKIRNNILILSGAKRKNLPIPDYPLAKAFTPGNLQWRTSVYLRPV